MNFKNITPGENAPNDIYVIVEIPYHTNTIKYEINKKTQQLFVDRFIPTSMLYPCNYGYINKTLSEDGDPLDVIIPIPYPLQPTCIIQCQPIGILKMIDEAGADDKIIAMPHKNICEKYKNIQHIDQISEIIKLKITHFFQHYKDLEKNKWVKIIGFDNAQTAKLKILQSIQKYQEIQL
ncbi:inorganic diphosphatase [Buchnera aphidicola]|uniref:inorganic diphosphatase n=1 Tax=Buchnera aphidicola TaxID=9 RepID=UPI0031B832DA